MSDVFKIKQADAVALCIAVGYANADKYNSTRLQQRTASLDEVITPEVMESITEPKVKKRAKQLLAALQQGATVEVAGEDAPAKEEADAPKPPKNGKAKKGKEKAGPAAEEEPAEEKPAKKPKGGKKPEEKPAKDKKSKSEPAKGDGVIATIAGLLMKASEKKPTTKQAVLDELVKKFPDRDAKSMQSTINHQIPSYLKKAGYKVEKSDRGYWIEA